MAVTSRAVAIHDHHTWTGFGSSRFNSREPKHSCSIQYNYRNCIEALDLKLATAQETVEPAYWSYCFARGRLEKVCMRHVFTMFSHSTGNDQISGSTVEGYEEISCWLPRFGRSHTLRSGIEIYCDRKKIEHQWLTSHGENMQRLQLKNSTIIQGYSEYSYQLEHLNHINIAFKSC